MSDHLGDLVTAYVDGELADDERLDADVHLGECEHCRVAVANERSIAALLGALPNVEPPAGFYEQLLKGSGPRFGLAYPIHGKRRWQVAAANVAAIAAVWLVVVSLWQGTSTMTPSTAKLVDVHREATALGAVAPVMTPVVQDMADDLGVPATLGNDFVLFDVDGDGEVGGWNRVAMYSDGTNQVTLFRQRAEMRWDDLSDDGFQAVQADRGWRGMIDGYEVFIVQRGGYAYALVGKDQTAVDAAVVLLPSSAEPSIVDRMRDAARGLVEAFSLKG